MISLETRQLTAAIDARGAQMVSLKMSDGPELVWQGNPKYWPVHALILFPVIGPLVGGVFRHGGKEYPMPPHGFAHLRDFSLVERSSNRCVLELRDDLETRACYPFAFRLRVEFELSDGRLLNTIGVENLDRQPMPADVGFHPGFNWPLVQADVKEAYTLVFERDEPAPIRRGTGDPIFLYRNSLPTPVEANTLHLRDELFKDLAIVFDRLASRFVIFGPPAGLALKVDFPDCPYLALWMVPGATYLCIEPWQGYPSELDFTGAFIDKPGTALIPPGETRRWRMTVTPQCFQ